MYGKLSSEADLKLRLKNRGDGLNISALKNGHLTIVKENGSNNFRHFVSINIVLALNIYYEQLSYTEINQIAKT